MKNLRLRQDLPISINDRVILSFRMGFIFTKVSRNKSPREIFRINSMSLYYRAPLFCVAFRCRAYDGPIRILVRTPLPSVKLDD